MLMSMIHFIMYSGLLFFVFLSIHIPEAIYGVYTILLFPLVFPEYTRPDFPNWKGIFWGLLFSAVYFPFVSSFWNPETFLTALSEEIFFRAYLQNIMTVRWGAVRGIIFSSILFTIPHLILEAGLLSLLVFIPSLIFGFLYYRFKNVWTPAIFHYFSNIFFQEKAPLLGEGLYFWSDLFK
ncbi:CPBP family glutamic-type intramembrane protease [Persephonella sp.]